MPHLIKQYSHLTEWLEILELCTPFTGSVWSGFNQSPHSHMLFTAYQYTPTVMLYISSCLTLKSVANGYKF